MHNKLEVNIVDCEIPSNCTIIEPVNLYGCKFGENVFVGPFVEIQTGVVIGDNSKIQSHSFLCEGVSIGQNCFIGHGVVFINDLFRGGGPANGDKSKWGKTVVKDNVSIGSNATVLAVNICSGVVVGAGSVVTKDINEPGVYAGNPARRIK